MSAYFFDASAFVKRFAREAGTSFVIGLLRPSNRHSITVARITEVEVCAALARRRKAHKLTPLQVQKSQRRCRRDCSRRFLVVAINQTVIDEAVLVADTYELRGYDAVQLASALLANRERLQRNLPPLIFVSADKELNQAAQAEGFVIEDPNNYP